MPEESDLERKCVKLAEEHGFWLPKWSSPGHRGVMDRILFRPHRITFIEFKARGKKPRNLQSFIAKKVRSYGFDAVVIDSVVEFKKLLDS